MTELSLDQGVVPLEFKQKVMDQLLHISDFLYLVMKEKVSTSKANPLH